MNENLLNRLLTANIDHTVIIEVPLGLSLLFFSIGDYKDIDFYNHYAAELTQRVIKYCSSQEEKDKKYFSAQLGFFLNNCISWKYIHVDLTFTYNKINAQIENTLFKRTVDHDEIYYNLVYLCSALQLNCDSLVLKNLLLSVIKQYTFYITTGVDKKKEVNQYKYKILNDYLNKIREMPFFSENTLNEIDILLAAYNPVQKTPIKSHHHSFKNDVAIIMNLEEGFSTLLAENSKYTDQVALYWSMIK